MWEELGMDFVLFVVEFGYVDYVYLICDFWVVLGVVLWVYCLEVVD